MENMIKELPDPISKEVNKMNRSKRILDLLKENKIHELKDQFGKKVPKDLVLLPSPKDLEEKDIDVVMGAPWYEANGVLMASSKAIEYLSEDDPLDAGINLNDLNLEISYVADALKRYEEDGFYLA